jgi:hypothetical protein
MEMKTCLDCSERDRSSARNCHFCGIRFDAPAASRTPERVIAIGLGALLASGVAMSIAVLVLAAMIVAAGAVAHTTQRRTRRAKRWTATGQFARV